jgi:hypothetical protein
MIDALSYSAGWLGFICGKPCNHLSLLVGLWSAVRHAFSRVLQQQSREACVYSAALAPIRGHRQGVASSDLSTQRALPTRGSRQRGFVALDTE